MRRRRKKQRKLFIPLLTFIAAMVLISTYASDYFAADKLVDKDGVTDFLPSDYQTLELGKEELHRGDLILVRSGVPYQEKQNDDMASVFEVKDSSYQVKDKNVKLNSKTAEALDSMLRRFAKETKITDVNVISGFRSVDLQRQLFDEKVSQTNEKEAQRWVARPGYSEHHSGYAADLGIYKNGASLTFDGKGKYKWISNHAHEYGFILRYTPDKEKQTGIAGEAWHFRYVGAPHAYYMKQKDLCMEEYLEHLKNYPYRSKHLKVSDEDGTEYEIYYVKAEEGTTAVPVPREKEYSISGDNQDGFIVTVKL